MKKNTSKTERTNLFVSSMATNTNVAEAKNTYLSQSCGGVHAYLNKALQCKCI